MVEMLKQLCLEQDTSQTLFFAADLTPQAVPPKVREIEIPPSKPSARVERKTRKQILQVKFLRSKPRVAMF